MRKDADEVGEVDALVGAIHFWFIRKTVVTVVLFGVVPEEGVNDSVTEGVDCQLLNYLTVLVVHRQT